MEDYLTRVETAQQASQRCCRASVRGRTSPTRSHTRAKSSKSVVVAMWSCPEYVFPKVVELPKALHFTLLTTPTLPCKISHEKLNADPKALQKVNILSHLLLLSQNRSSHRRKPDAGSQTTAPDWRPAKPQRSKEPEHDVHMTTGVFQIFHCLEGAKEVSW